MWSRNAELNTELESWLDGIPFQWSMEEKSSTLAQGSQSHRFPPLAAAAVTCTTEKPGEGLSSLASRRAHI